MTITDEPQRSHSIDKEKLCADCGLSADDPIRKLGRRRLRQRTSQTPRDEIERGKGGSRQGDALSGKGGIDGKRRLIENRAVLGFGTFDSKCGEPLAPEFAAAVVDQHTPCQIRGSANRRPGMQERGAACRE